MFSCGYQPRVPKWLDTLTATNEIRLGINRVLGFDKILQKGIPQMQRANPSFCRIFQFFSDLGGVVTIRIQLPPRLRIKTRPAAGRDEFVAQPIACSKPAPARGDPSLFTARLRTAGRLGSAGI